MSRRYSGAKGKSASKQPLEQKVPAWVALKPAEIEKTIVKLAHEKMTASMIGLTLRDSYGIPSVQIATGKSVTEILDEHKANKSIPQDLIDAIARAIKVQKHLGENKQDKAALRGLTLAQSRIGRLVKYYKKNDKIPQDWKFDATKAGMYLE